MNSEIKRMFEVQTTQLSENKYERNAISGNNRLQYCKSLAARKYFQAGIVSKAKKCQKYYKKY